MWRMTGGTGWTEQLVTDIVWDSISAWPAPEISKEIVAVSPDSYTCIPVQLQNSCSAFAHIWTSWKSGPLFKDSLETYLSFEILEYELCMDRWKLNYIRELTGNSKVCRTGSLARADRYLFMGRIRSSSSKSANYSMKAGPPHHRDWILHTGTCQRKSL